MEKIIEKRLNKKCSVAVIAWDVTHNALGRAYMLAEALSSKYDVKIYGFAFKNNSIWEPLKKGEIPVIVFPGGCFPDFKRQMEHIVPQIEADVALVSKPRLPSLQLGLLWKSEYKKPLILDIDDCEVSFFIGKSNSLDCNDIRKPQGEIWTNFCENLIHYADHVFVSNIALQNKYGGTVIPHARDENIFNPSLYSKETRRNELGIAINDKIILFLGSPKKHKGLLKLLTAIKKTEDQSYKLCIMGSFISKNLEEKLKKEGEQHILFFPDQPFNEIAKNMIVADLVCLLQDEESEISKYQLPAKVIDAISMGIPVLATPTPPMEDLIKQGLVLPTSNNSLQSDIVNMLTNRDYYQKKQLDKRPVFLKYFSYGAISQEMASSIYYCRENLKALPDKALSYTLLQSELLNEATELMEVERIRNKDLHKKVIKLEKEAKQLQCSYRSILNSTTWKYTAPLRFLSKYIRRVMSAF